MNAFSAIELRIKMGENVSEEDVRQAFNSYIITRVEKEHKKSIIFKNEKKTSTGNLVDSEYNEIIIEYKKPSKNLSDDVRNQLFGYLSNDSQKYKIGILTNYKEIEVYYINQETSEITKNKEHSGVVTTEKLDFIVELFSKINNKIITNSNINHYFGLEKNKEIIKRLFNYLADEENMSSRTKLLYSEWKKLFNLSDEYDKLDFEKKSVIINFYESLLDCKIDKVTKEYKALFAIQTYYSIIVKLLVNKLMLNFNLKNIQHRKFYKDYFEKIESNEFYLDHNITNLIDGDFFSWYLKELLEKDFQDIYEITRNVAQVKLDINSKNLLLVFYENIFPFHVRHAMGEYYTPSYLADKVLKKAISLYQNQNSNLKFLDPTCGSGVFILSALKSGYKNVFGVDINPLAVLTSKINYLMSMGLPREKFEIPIYLGDSTYVEKIKVLDGIEYLEYDLYTSLEDLSKIKFTFPLKAIRSIDFFLYLNRLEIAIKQLNRDNCLAILKEVDVFEYSSFKDKYIQIIENLIKLEEKELNSIWLKIIGNYLKANAILDVDIIIGNPPWVRWSNLPDKYRDIIKAKCRIDGVFSDDKNVGGVDLNICALIAYISFRDRLNKNGVLGFLMPDSILFNKSFQGFRKFEFPEDDVEGYLTEVIRWNDQSERPFDPVSLSFGEYYYTHNKTKTINVFDRKLSQEKIGVQLGGTDNNYSIVSKFELDGIKKMLGNNKLKFRSGISLIKNGHYLLEFIEDINEKYAMFKVIKTSKILMLEKEIIYPFISSPDIKDNIIKKAVKYAIFPYPNNSRIPYSMDDIKHKFPEFYKYFNTTEVQKSFNTSSSFNKRVQNVKNDVGIFRVGEYTYNDYFLVTRDNTKSTFAKVGKLITHWGEFKMPLFDGHVNIISRNEQNKPLTELEMNKLYDIFTNTHVKLYIKLSSDSRSISGRLYNNIKI